MKIKDFYLFKTAKELNQEAIKNGCDDVNKLPYSREQEKMGYLYSKMEVEIDGKIYFNEVSCTKESYRYDEWLKVEIEENLVRSFLDIVYVKLKEDINSFNRK